MKVRLSPDAVDDLDGIEEFGTARWGTAQSARYLAMLRAAADRLAANPSLGRARDGVPRAYRLYSVASHVVVFRADPAADQLVVLRVLHQKMDVGRRVLATLRSPR